VLEASGGLRLVLEPAHHVRIRRDPWQQELDGAAAGQLRVARVVDGAHAATAKQTDDLVPVDDGPDPRRRQVSVVGRIGAIWLPRRARAASASRHVHERTSSSENAG
jgi:hypothetical protein